MLSINTNLSSLIAQSGMKSSTNALNQAIERMTTGLKINHASDNAANYSISTNLTTKIGAYQIAEENVAMGLDMLATTTETLDQINDKLAHLRALAVQANNGTYNDKSVSVIDIEAKAIINEIERLYKTAQFNGIKLLDSNPEIPGEESKPKISYGKFISDPVDYSVEDFNDMKTVEETSTFLNGVEYSISKPSELVKLAKYVNDGGDTSGVIFVLANDIDMGNYSLENEVNGGWDSIGYRNGDASIELAFKGTFNGNGNKITNIKINKPSDNSTGLFACTEDAVIKNLGLENIEIVAYGSIGALAGRTKNTEIINCYAKNVDATANTGYYLGGLVGYSVNNDISSCYVINTKLKSESSCVGGLIGSIDTQTNIESSFAKAKVEGQREVGGFLGASYAYSNISNCFSESQVDAKGTYAGGFIGYYINSTIENCHSNSIVVGNDYVGGFVGMIEGDSIQLGNTSLGSAKGKNFVGGFAGRIHPVNIAIALKDSISYCEVEGENSVGSFIGSVTCSGNVNKLDNLTLQNCSALQLGINMIGGTSDSNASNASVTYDMSNWLNEISIVNLLPKEHTLQVGISGNDSSSIKFETIMISNSISQLRNIDISSGDTIKVIDELVETISVKQTDLGAAQNRLMSALDEISTQYENLVSTRSTIRDADIAEVSSHYIQQQILQQAAATLMATANQTPAIALQLI